MNWIKRNFQKGDMRKYRRTVMSIPPLVFIFLTLDLMFGSATIEADGTIIGTIFGVFIFTIIFSLFVIALYTICSPTFWGWLTKKLKRA